MFSYVLDARRNIAYVLKAIWNNPTHRAALNAETKLVVIILLNDMRLTLLQECRQIRQIRQPHDQRRDLPHG